MPPDFKKINLQDTQTLPMIQQEARRIIENNWTDHASKLWHALRDALPTITDQGLAGTYQVIMQDLGWILLPILTEAQRFALLRGSLLRAIQIGIELESALTRLVYTIPPMIWLEVVPQYLQALRGNTEPLGPKTLGAWFSDFQRTMPDRKPTDLDVLRYLGQDPAAKELTEAEHTLLIKAFQYYIGLTPLSLAEVDTYVTPEERDAFMGGFEDITDASDQSPAAPSGLTPPFISAEPPSPLPAPSSVSPESQAAHAPPVSPPDFAPLPQSPYMAESDSPLDRTPIARPRRGEELRVKELENQRFYGGSPSPETIGRSQESRGQNESVVNLRQPPRYAVPQNQPVRPSVPPPTPQRQPAPSAPPRPPQPFTPPPPPSSPPSRLPRPFGARNDGKYSSAPPRPAPAPSAQPTQPRPAPQYTPPQRASISQAPLPAVAPQGAKAGPPPNLPVVKHTHNEGQELTPYRPPEHDPFMPHKPKPVPKLAGNVVDLKR